MTTTSTRRAILAGALALPMASIPALADKSISSAEEIRRAWGKLDPGAKAVMCLLAREDADAEAITKDAKLLDLGKELDKAHAHYLKALIPEREASKRYERMKPPEPALPKPPAKYAKLWKKNYGWTDGNVVRRPSACCLEPR